MKTNIPSPKELDNQASVKIKRWIDIHSEECRMKDQNQKTAIKWMRLLMASPGPALFTDSNGRLWGKGKEGGYFPYHFEDENHNLYGYRLSKNAFN